MNSRKNATAKPHLYLVRGTGGNEVEDGDDYDEEDVEDDYYDEKDYDYDEDPEGFGSLEDDYDYEEDEDEDEDEDQYDNNESQRRAEQAGHSGDDRGASPWTLY